MATLKVVVTLTPLSSPEHFVRKIELTTAKSKAYIGRASKNETKGIIAAENNGWFDSPIMSRQHALLSMSSLPKRIFLQDCGSTHGTFISGERLSALKPYALNQWDVVTFGSKVTSGIAIYDAQDFRIGFEWETVSSSSSVNTPKALPSISNGFSVPDDDNDSSSDASIADSVQMLGHQTRTYSVPSSVEDDESQEEEEDDDDEVDEDVLVPNNYQPAADRNRETADLPRFEAQKPEDHSRAFTDLHRAILASAKPQSPPLPPSIGASQANPITLEDAHRRQTCINIVSDSESESEDEGPGILSMGSTSAVNDAVSSLDKQNVKSPAIREHQSAEILQAEDSLSNDDCEVDRRSVVASAGYPDNYAQSFNDDQHLTEPHENSKAQDHLAGQSHESRSSKENFSDRDIYHGDDHSSLRINSVARAPSPSDAALAKKPSVVDTDNDECLLKSLYESQATIKKFTTRAQQSEKLGPLQKGAQHKVEKSTERRNKESFSYGPGVSYWTDPKMNATWDDGWSSFLEDSHDMPSIPKAYHDGPFSTRSLQSTHYNPRVSTASYLDCSSEPVNSASRRPAYAYAAEPPLDANWLSHEYLAQYETEIPKRRQWECVGSPPACSFTTTVQQPTNNHLANQKPVWAEKHVTSSSGWTPPRVPIANLLSQPNPTDAELPSPPMSPKALLSKSKGTKRKADELETDEVEVVPDSIPNAFVSLPESQPSTLHDAQPREPVASVEPTITQISQDSFVLQGQGSSQSQLKALATRESGPARKKTRTGSSKTGGIAKFVSGVAFGVVGVLAAFIATIPDSVREEAMREVNKIK